MGVLFGDQASRLCTDYKERGLQLYSPRQDPLTTTDRVLQEATHTAKDIVARFLLFTDPVDPFHIKAVELMHCFQEIRFKYPLPAPNGTDDSTTVAHVPNGTDDSTTVAHVPNGTDDSTTVAHVVYHLIYRRPNIILFDDFFRQNRRGQAITIIHECSHLYNGSSDHAYVWDPLFAKLLEHQHLSNADSIAGRMANPYI